MRLLGYISILLLVSTSGLAQDNHYSLYEHRLGSLNPALTGFNQEYGEARTLYRTQWNAIAPHNYITLEAEKQDGLWGYGLNWNKNSAGVGTLVTNQISLGASRQVELSNSGFLSLGLQLGYYSHALDWEGAVFEEQFDPLNGSQSTENGEQLTLGKSSALDVNTGLFLSTKAGESRLNIGAGLFHVAKNRLSLYSDGSELLRSRKVLHANFQIPRENDWTLEPNMLLQAQGTANEFMLGVNGTKQLEPNKSLTTGVGMRFKDAIILKAKFQLENLGIALAYDINTSKLSRINNGFGGFEIGLSFRFTPAKDYNETVNLRIKDADNDGVADESDHCPDVPGSAANHGCPGRVDSDGDGIVDDVDLCPGLAGSSIHGGCPDSDGDGVADIDDECPTIYGAIQFQGCPDSDQDGISDKYDACPVTFGLISNKGCPDSKSVQPTTVLGEYIVNDAQNVNQKFTNVLPIAPPTHHKHSYVPNSGVHQYENTEVYSAPNSSEPEVRMSEAYSTLENGEITESLIVFFDSDESTLDFLDKKRLKDFAQKVNTNPNLKLVLKGHTDENGNDLYNMELGFRRSESVKRYLSQFGIADAQMMTLSYGEEMPMSVVQGEYSDAQNRRVEIMLVE